MVTGTGLDNLTPLGIAHWYFNQLTTSALDAVPPNDPDVKLTPAA